MRTLSRPMFNMGGPIKEGIMHGIREPHQVGQIVGRLAPMASKIFGRIKNIFGRTGPKNVEIGQQIKWRPPVSGHSKGYTGIAKPGAWERGAPITETQNIFTPHPWAAATGKYLKGSPEAALLTGAWKGKGVLGKPLKWAAKSPVVMGGLVWTGVSWLRKDGSPASTAEIELNKAQHGPFDHTPKKKTKEATAAFAKSQREKRVNKYLDLMGYDRSKKLAIADALIDASKIVGERGTLDPKNITQELINPIIQATSKRLDKPQQIREAVGLMMTKAGLEKEMYDAKPGTMMKNIEDLVASGMSEQEAKDIVLKQSKGVGSDIMNYMASQKGKVKEEQLENIARLSAYDHKVPFSKITDEEVAATPALEGMTSLEIVAAQKTDGVYMVGDIVFEIKGGQPRQLTFG